MGSGSSRFNKNRKSRTSGIPKATSLPDIPSENTDTARSLSTRINDIRQTSSQPIGTSFNSGVSSGENKTSGKVAAVVNPEPDQKIEEDMEGFGGLIVFSFKDIARATDNFNERYMLGEGGFGKVYRGRIRLRKGDEPTECAVKRLNPESFQGQNEWLTEILFLSKLSHPQLVKLYGYCSDGGEGLLVYEFLSNGSVDYHIFGPFPEGLTPMPWKARLKVLLQATEGLQYLHENNIIHRDFKPPNILLDKEFNAKLTDFGLAKDADTDKSHITTRIMGTIGYLDPRYMEVGHLSKRSDIYSLGIMILEMITGKRALEQGVPDAVPLATWAQTYLAARRPDIPNFLDPAIRDQVSSKSSLKVAHKLAIAAKHCVERDPKFRPPLADMLDTLRALIAANESG